MKCSICGTEVVAIENVTYCLCCGLLVEKTMEEAINKITTFQETLNKYEEAGESC